MWWILRLQAVELTHLEDLMFFPTSRHSSHRIHGARSFKERINVSCCNGTSPGFKNGKSNRFQPFEDVSPSPPPFNAISGGGYTFFFLQVWNLDALFQPKVINRNINLNSINWKFPTFSECFKRFHAFSVSSLAHIDSMIAAWKQEGHRKWMGSGPLADSFFAASRTAGDTSRGRCIWSTSPPSKKKGHYTSIDSKNQFLC